MRERVLELSRKKGFSNQDKSAIKKMCVELGIDVAFKSGCPNCYMDALALLRNALNITAIDVFGVVGENSNYKMCKSTKVVWFCNGVTKMLSASSSDKDIEDFIENNPYQRIFIKNE